MQKNNVCPCPKLEFPNHGNCEDCTSRHLRLGFLNYCGFYASLPFLKEVITASPDSPSAKLLKKKLEHQSNAYCELKKKYYITDEEELELRKAKSRLSKH